MPMKTYHVRHPQAAQANWVVELDQRSVFAASSQVDAIGAAIDAARAAAREGTETRVTLEHEAGFSYTLSRFSDRVQFAL